MQATLPPKQKLSRRTITIAVLFPRCWLIWFEYGNQQLVCSIEFFIIIIIILSPLFQGSYHIIFHALPSLRGD